MKLLAAGMLLCVLGIGIGALPQALAREPDTEEQLGEIQKKLDTLLEGQQKIMETQKTLSEEHTQIRQWVHHR